MENAASIVLAVIFVGVLIIVHETGHFLAARFSRMGVHRFAVGFGPALAKFVRKGTTFQIGAIPLGGYVQIEGMNPHDGDLLRSPTSYASKPFHLKFATILAGSFANFALAFLVFWGVFAFFQERPLPPIRIDSVQKESPAAKAGLREGDIVLGTPTETFDDFRDLETTIRSAKENDDISLRVRRSEEVLSVVVRPTLQDGRRIIGIRYSGVNREDASLGIGPGAVAAWDALVATSIGGFVVLVRAVLRQETAGVEVQSVFGIVGDLSKSIQRSWSETFMMLAHLSSAIGFLNLLPIPGLDGSRLMFLVLGMIRRRELNPVVEAWVHAIGILMLIGVMIVVSIGDILG